MRCFVLLCSLLALLLLHQGELSAVAPCETLPSPCLDPWIGGGDRFAIVGCYDCDEDDFGWSWFRCFLGQTLLYEEPCWRKCCGCFVAGTMITLADGQSIPIELLSPGTPIMVYNPGSGTLERGEVIAVHPPRTVDHYLVVNGSIRVTSTHTFLSNSRWVPIGDLSLGDLLTSKDGVAVPIVSVEHVFEETTVYNIASDPHGIYVAEGLIVHNKPDPPEHYEPDPSLP